jgi:hypothetical protein
MNKIFKIFIEDDQNPAFKYLRDEYSLDCSKFSQSADIIMSAAIGSAKKFEEVTSLKINNHLIHYFFDLLLCLNSGLFTSDTDVSSSIIDGIHIKYFGQPSQEKISSATALAATKETCLLISLFELLKKDDFPRMLAVFAYFSAIGELVGASKGLWISEIVAEIIKIVSPKLNSKLSDIIVITFGQNRQG